MAQTTKSPTLLHQINAGIRGRRKGHSYEKELTRKINSISMPFNMQGNMEKIIHVGSPAEILLEKILDYFDWNCCEAIEAYATGTLATSEYGEKEILVEGQSIKSAKSDVIITLYKGEEKKTIGVSVKQCNNKAPTNAQVFFSTATAFYNMIKNNVFPLSDTALKAMRQFCGDPGYRPKDDFDCSNRISNPERYFWEEIDSKGRTEWEDLFLNYQDDVTRLLLQKGYPNNPFPPEIILHKTKKAVSFDNQEIAIFTIDQFIALSKKYSPFCHSTYRVKKGSHKEPESVSHQAPRFGVIQMQRGGQKQHPTQLQFNLKAGYFYDLDKM